MVITQWADKLHHLHHLIEGQLYETVTRKNSIMVEI